MASNKRYKIGKMITATVWLLLGVGLIVLLVAAISKKNEAILKHIEISIDGVQNHYFIDKADVRNILENVNKKSLDKAVASSLDLVGMEKQLQKQKWIKNAELFFDNNNILQVKITEREPVARIFTTTGNSFYIDSSLMKLPLSDKFSPRLPVFTNFPTDVIVLSRVDSLLLKDIKLMGRFIEGNEFWMAQIDQVDITPNRTFELIPKVGNQVIRFGNMDNYEEKFNNLLAFYKRVQTRINWNKYSFIDVQFKNQVVAVKRDAREVKADSLRAIQVMKSIIEEAQKRTNDSTIIQLNQKDDQEHIDINHSRVRDEVPENNSVPANSPVSVRTDVPGATVQTEVSRNLSTSVPVKATSASPVKKITAAPVKKERPGSGNEVQKKVAPKVKEPPKAVMPPKEEIPPPGDYD